MDIDPEIDVVVYPAGGAVPNTFTEESEKDST
jgi:hypothetical protein